ncbi:MAG TPA: hypothetical protein VD926_09110, partial [Acidimicrobiales bacterium]|nr:hypothetical protein [Acidimicrobiales bacterium]
GVLVAIASLGGLLPGDIGEVSGVALVALLVAVPAIRVLWLAVRWTHKGDRRFAGLALLLVLLAAAGAALGTTT